MSLFTAILQETPMKLSEVHNKLSHPPLRRMSPLESRDLFHIEGLPRALLPLGSMHSARSPVRVISSGNKLLYTPKNKSPLSPQPAQHLVSACSPSANVTNASDRRSAPALLASLCPTPPPFMKDLSNQPLNSHIKKKHVTKSKGPFFNSGSDNASSARLESEKVRFILFFKFIQNAKPFKGNILTSVAAGAELIDLHFCFHVCVCVSLGPIQ